MTGNAQFSRYLRADLSCFSKDAVRKLTTSYGRFGAMAGMMIMAENTVSDNI